ncbi:MAG: hypothetical protein ABR58_05415 [Acidimicrobium sp. BACL19 MAG-120924-bin39]|nr:MAG: hypothetical protein ABR58_05415 [Acidimicrobium sp. BACL19 MAG-120924-bin39]
MTRVVRLEHDDVCVVVDVSGGVPAIMHWGAALGAVDTDTFAALTNRPTTHGSLDVVPALQIVPQHSLGSLARPGLAGHRPGGRDWAPRFTTCSAQVTSHSIDTSSRDEVARLRLDTRIELTKSGALRVSAVVTNEGDSRYLLDALTVSLPVPAQAQDLITYSGRWARESTTHRHAMHHGAWTTENRTGRTSHEYPPMLWWCGTDAREWSGEVWGCHLEWSGNHALLAEVLPDGRRYAQLGELLLPGEVCLDPGTSYASPVVVGAYSAEGLTPASWVMHRAARSHSASAPKPRKVLLNTWEATYFDHDTKKLCALADAAAAIGVERFVLDDGWFGARRHDRAGLGDWVVSSEVYPAGLEPLINHVAALGMDFGIWVEPEMVNLDSDVLRAHPDWVLHAPDYEPVLARHQLVLDLTNDAAYAHVLGQLDALLRNHRIAFVKWDMNRPLIHATSADGAAGAHRQTMAFYRLVDELRASTPMWSLNRVHRVVGESTTVCCNACTVCGLAIASTRSSASASSAGWACGCPTRCWVCMLVLVGRTPLGVRTVLSCARSPHCLAGWVWNVTHANSTTTNNECSAKRLRCTKNIELCCMQAMQFASTSTMTPRWRTVCMQLIAVKHSWPTFRWPLHRRSWCRAGVFLALTPSASTP